MEASVRPALMSRYFSLLAHVPVILLSHDQLHECDEVSIGLLLVVFCTLSVGDVVQYAVMQFTVCAI